MTGGNLMENSSCACSEKLHQPTDFQKIKVKFGKNVFTLDRSLLEENCDFFRALFQSGMKECHQDEISLQKPSVRGFYIALRVINGESPMLNDHEIVDAIECAAFLQIEILTEHLINIINSDNCLLMYHTASTFGLRELFKSASLFIRDMYSDLKEHAKCLPEDLIDYVETLVPSTYVMVGTHSPGIKLLQDFMRTVCYLDEDEKDWKVLTHLPLNASTTMAGVTALDNKIYIVGGVYDMTNKVVDSGFCYDVLTDTWSTFSNPQQLRFNCTLVGHDGDLYVIGGEYEKSVMSSVEKYRVSSDTWSFVAHLPRAASAVACTKAMRRLFICLWRPKDATEIYEYVAKKDEWRLITTLVRHQSYGHCMVAHRDNLYVMRNGPSDDFLRCMMDCYNLTSGQWTALAGQYENSKGALFTAVVRGDSAFTVNRRATVEYAIEDDKWRTKKEMTGFPRIGSKWTFLLRLPKKREEISELNKGREEISCDFRSSASVHCED
ncbi:kelch repeat and BTB domain-containing protein 13 [Danio rerio]|uniref:Kelch repeat and BTB domain-containing protein 13 n=1 Tax=Danio rerio TaxID=7955 RepID=A0A8M1PS76_DANRE|nr:kelch repeat and BTB domain-containing protein 13 [Danio rerio]|eukprot:XP_001337700.4 kelch repeat and BTB domain-containing protein 13 [Danio rerio]